MKIGCLAWVRTKTSGVREPPSSVALWRAKPAHCWLCNKAFECGFRNVECGVKKGVRLAFLPVHSALRTQHSTFRIVAREGIAPSTSLRRRDMILFHHRAVEARLAKNGCRGWNGLPKPCKLGSPNGIIRYRELQCTSIRVPQCGSAVLRLDDPAMEWLAKPKLGT